MSETLRSYSTARPAPDVTIAQALTFGYITPPGIATYYGIPASTGAGVKVGIISLGGGFLQSDLQKSFNDLYAAGQLASNIAPTVNFISVDGASNAFVSNSNDPSFENTLDIFCVAAMVPRATINIYIAPNLTSSFYNAIQRAVNDNCDVISISWGGPEFSNYLAAPLAAAAANGITVLVASGDNGSSATGAPSEAPQYPASSADVLAVGGTLLENLNTSPLEYAAQRSGGGISSIIPVPAWQNGAQYTTYTDTVTHVLYTGQIGSGQGRGIPDIAAPFYNYVFYFNGGLVSGEGTSFACPVMAGMIARFVALNGRRPVNGARTLNTRFYSNIGAFNNSSFSTTFNESNHTLTTPGNDDYIAGINGYVASAGQWNPITGLGSPCGTEVYQLATSGGTRVKTASNTWSYVSNVKVKTDTTTWSNVQAIWTKTINGWQQTY